MKKLSMAGVSPLVVAGLVAVALLAVGAYLYVLASSGVTLATLGWKQYKSADATLSFRYPSGLALSTNALSAAVAGLALAPKPSYDFSQMPCSARYLVTIDQSVMSFDDISGGLAVAYVGNPKLVQMTISGHRVVEVSGTSDGKTLSDILAPNGAAVDIAFIDNGATTINFSTCGTSANKAEFDRILSTFRLTGALTSEPLSFAAVQQEAQMRARDAQRRSDVIDLSEAAAVYQANTGTYPVRTSCTDVALMKAELSDTGRSGATAPNFFDPKAMAGAANYEASWPNYCYQSDAQGTKFIIWAKAEAAVDKGITVASVGTPGSSQYFTPPSAFLPNATYSQQ